MLPTGPARSCRERLISLREGTPARQSKPGNTRLTDNARNETGPFSERELEAWRGLLATHAEVTRTLDAEMHAEHGLSLSAYEVLIFLADAPDQRLRMADISEQALLTRSGCTRLVDRLAQLGYVTRCAAKCDGRGTYAQLTEAGVEAVKEARKTHRSGVRREYLGRLSATDQQSLGRIWSRFRDP